MKVFLTGASSGIGAALARRYAAHGATLGLVARSAGKLDALLHSLPLPPSGAHRIYVLDVRDHGALQDAARDFMARVGTPDIVIANAGISIGTLSEYAEDLDVFQQVLDTNLVAMVATFQPFIAPMRRLAAEARATRPQLVGIASVAGVRGLPGSEAYCASKAAVIAYCESLRVRLKRDRIDVVTIMPGFIATPMTAKNPYRMPFLTPVDQFAARAIAAIDAHASYCVIPWQMAVVAKLLRLLPNWLLDLAFSRVRHKPRKITV